MDASEGAHNYGVLCLLRLRRKLLRSSTRMRLPILISLRAWARLFLGGLHLSQQSPNRCKVGLWNSLVRGRRYVTLAKWVTEVGHLPPSSLGNFSVIKETHFCGANCVAILQCELRLRQLHLHKVHKSTDNLNWRLKLSSSHLFLPQIAARARVGHKYFWTPY